MRTVIMIFLGLLAIACAALGLLLGRIRSKRFRSGTFVRVCVRRDSPDNYLRHVSLKTGKPCGAGRCGRYFWLPRACPPKTVHSGLFPEEASR
jgi:hypothetical protein